MKNCLIGAAFWRIVFDIAAKKSQIANLKSQTEKPDFWKNLEKAKKIQKEISDLEKEIKNWSDLETEAQNLLNFIDSKDAAEKFKSLELRFNKLELVTFLSGKYDKNNALLTISAGVGGRDSQDWASMLFRMYSRYCEAKDWDVTVLHESL